MEIVSGTEDHSLFPKFGNHSVQLWGPRSVWVKPKDIPLKSISKKLSPRYIGPCEKESVLSLTAVWLRLPASLSIHSTFHVLQPFTSSPRGACWAVVAQNSCSWARPPASGIHLTWKTFLEHLCHSTVTHQSYLPFSISYWNTLLIQQILTSNNLHSNKETIQWPLPQKSASSAWSKSRNLYYSAPLGKHCTPFI